MKCYTEEWRRTGPDFVVYLPPLPACPHADNEHFIVSIMPDSHDLLATWTTGSYESAVDSHTVYSRSRDGGRSWSAPIPMPGTADGPLLGGRWGFPIAGRSGRVYFFFNRSVGAWDASYSTDGGMSCSWSDDDGHTWKTGGDIPFRRRPGFSHPDPSVPCGWIVWQRPIRDVNGAWIAGFTRWSSLSAYPRPQSGYHLDTRSELMRFENIDDGPAVEDLTITWLPEEDAVSVPCPIEPEKSKGYSLAEEPAVVLLPDGRLLMTMRTLTGRIWYSVSEDNGASWRASEPLRQCDGGKEMLHPKSPCPLYRLQDGRYLLFFHNHDGNKFGAKGPQDMNARRPVFLSVGEFRPQAHQPVWFDEPKLLFDTDGVAVGPGNGTVEGGRMWLSLYGSLTERDGERVLWYPDRKHFLLGRILTDAFLEN